MIIKSSIVYLELLRGIKKRFIQYFELVMIVFILVTVGSTLLSTANNYLSSYHTADKASGATNAVLSLSNIRIANNSATKQLLATKVISDLKNQYRNLNDYEINSIKSDINNFNQDDLNLHKYDTKTKEYYDYINKLANKITNPQLKKYLENNAFIIPNVLITAVLSDTNEQLLNRYHYSLAMQKALKTTVFIKEKHLQYRLFSITQLKTKHEYNSDPVNDLYVYQGRKPVNDNEIVFDQGFIKKNNYEINKEYEILIQNNVKPRKLLVTGIGIDRNNFTIKSGIIEQYYAEDLKQYGKIKHNKVKGNIGYGFLNESTLFAIAKELHQVPYISIYLNIKNNYEAFLSDYAKVLQKYVTAPLVANKLGGYYRNILIEKINLLLIIQDIFIVIAIVLLLISALTVLLYSHREIIFQSNKIGVLKAFGYHNHEIAKGFSYLFFTLTFFASLFGFVANFLLQHIFDTFFDLDDYIFPKNEYYTDYYLIFIVIIFAPILFALTSYFITYWKLKTKTLTLLEITKTNNRLKETHFKQKRLVFGNFKVRIALALSFRSLWFLLSIAGIFMLVNVLTIFQYSGKEIIATNTKLSLFNSKITGTYEAANYFYNEKSNSSQKIFNWYTEEEFIRKQYQGNYEENDQLTPDQIKVISSDHKSFNEFIAYLLRALAKTNYNIKNYYFKQDAINLLLAHQNDAEVKNNFILETMIKAIRKQQIPLAKIKSNGILIGADVINSNKWPFQQFNLKSLIADENIWGPKLLGLTNFNDSDLNWSNWFNFKHENGKLQKIINSQTVNINNNALVVAVSGKLAVKNNIHVNDKRTYILWDKELNVEIPIVLVIKAIIDNDNYQTCYYVNSKSLLAKIQSYYSFHHNNKKNSTKIMSSSYDNNKRFNYFFVKDNDVSKNTISLINKKGKYDLNFLNEELIPLQINGEFVSSPQIVTKFLNNEFYPVTVILTIAITITFIAVFAFLVIIISAIIDYNLKIIALMKAFGYRLLEITNLIIIPYLIVYFFSFIISYFVVKISWNLIIKLISTKFKFILLLNEGFQTAIYIFLILLILLCILYAITLFYNKKRPIVRLLN